MPRSISGWALILMVACGASLSWTNVAAQSAIPRAPNNSQDAVRAEQANAVHAVAAGPIKLAVDASDAPRKIFHATLTVPVATGAKELTLVYPKWIPGEHGPTGPVTDLAGLKFTVGGQTLSWRRDLVDM